MQRRGVFGHLGKAANGLFKNIVGMVIVHAGNLANQHVTTVTPERMPNTGHQRHTLTRTQGQMPTGCQRAHLAIHRHTDGRIAVNAAIWGCGKEL